MATVITINQPEVIALIEQAAKQLTDGDTTEAVAQAIRGLLARNERKGSLFGRNPGSAIERAGVDLTAPMVDLEMDAETGRELEH